MEIKTSESIALETGNRMKKQTVESILVRIVLVYIIVVTVIFSYSFFENERLHHICSDVKCIESTSNYITVNEYNYLVDKIDSEGYILSYTIKDKYNIISSEQSGKIENNVPLANEDTLILTCTHKADSYFTDTITFKEYLVVDIKYKL